jgi:asparagine synthase (glutamine-hydrolysing)
MCGIAGQIDFTGAPVDPRLLAQMADSVRHRGPDGVGLWQRCEAGVGVGLAHQRLAVIDLSEAASQPMHNDACVAAGRSSPLAIVFNGEIYNYQDLRRLLTDAGHRLTTESDTEAILHLFEDYGPGCLRYLRGMFAFAIWDAANRRLFCARDRVGKKPLYYRHDGRRFWFASEPRAILVDPRVPDAVEPRAIHAYLALGYVPGAESAHGALHRLLPAHFLLATESGVRIERYWRLDRSPAAISEQDAARELRRLLSESVRMRLISDVPVGAFLSGGVDSSVVVATMARESASRISTYSIGFEDAGFNELPQARLVAERYGTDHHELIVRSDAAAMLPKLAWHYGEPYADSSALPTFQLAGLVRRHITVALNGDGGDENFAGYTRYWANWMALRYQRVPPVLRRTVERLAGRLVRASSGRTAAYDIQRFFAGASRPTAERYAGWFGFFDSDVLTPEFAASMAGHSAVASLESAFADAAGLHPLDAAMSVDADTYLPDDLLVKVDIASMAHGLEARSPLLDQEVMQFAARLPRSLKRRGRQGKYLLKKIAADMVPHEILNGPKRGFGVPLDRWFRDELRPAAEELLLGPSTHVTNYVRRASIESLLREHLTERRAHGHRLWALVMLELWHRTCVGAKAESPKIEVHV